MTDGDGLFGKRLVRLGDFDGMVPAGNEVLVIGDALVDAVDLQPRITDRKGEIDEFPTLDDSRKEADKKDAQDNDYRIQNKKIDTRANPKYRFETHRLHLWKFTALFHIPIQGTFCVVTCQLRPVVVAWSVWKISFPSSRGARKPS